MTNGYTGALSGQMTGSELELIYSYTIEGSKNKELEIYTLGADSLIKNRWTLKDEIRDGVHMLVPDKIGTPTLILYTEENC